VESLNTFQDDGGVARDATAVEACTSQASQVSELPNLGPIASLAPSSLFRGSLLASPSRSHMGAARDRKSSFAVSGEDVLKTLPDSSLMVATDVSELDFEVLINEARDLDNLKLSVLPYDPAQTSQESRLLTPNKQSELDTESSTPLPRLSKTSQEARSQSQALTGSENAEDGLGIPINGIRGIRGPPLSLPRDTFSMQGEEFGSASANEDELDFEILINSIQTRSLQTNLRGFISRMHQPSERISSPATKVCDMPQFDHELRAQSPPMNKTSYTCKSQEAQAGNNSTSTMLDDQRPSVESTPLPGQRQQHHCPPGKRPSAECLREAVIPIYGVSLH
ncbi:hypothetical protein CVT26_013174, partial [Gymnopilus dilepis]